MTDLNALIGKGFVNEWGAMYGTAANYLGYIEDDLGNVFHVPEDEALPLVNLLNFLIEALAEIAQETEVEDPTYYLRGHAYDELRDLGQIVIDGKVAK